MVQFHAIQLWKLFTGKMLLLIMFKSIYVSCFVQGPDDIGS